MRLYVGVTDYDWYQLHAANEALEEVNFWKPSPDASFKALTPGEPFLFKLHAPRNFIAGGGFFVRFLRLRISLAWEAFGPANGASSRAEMLQRIAKYRRTPIAPGDDPTVGCVLLAEPFFFDEQDWIPVPPDFSRNIVQGKGYKTDERVGKELWAEVGARLAQIATRQAETGPAVLAASETARYGKPLIVQPRLGQGTFRTLVTDAYGYRCSVTRERTLPVLEAAHIRPYSVGGRHELPNGILFRSDLHKLFDLGYMTVDPDSRQLVVSRRIREEYENGRDYYRLHGQPVQAPSEASALPSRDNLTYHAEHVFR